MVGDLLRNRATEKDIRDWLDRAGYVGSSANFDCLELKAVKPPGWVQVFEFTVRVSDIEDVRHEFFGVARDDERVGIDVVLAQTVEEQSAQTNVWSEGLITFKRKKQASPLVMALLTLFVAVMVLCLLAKILGR